MSNTLQQRLKTETLESHKRAENHPLMASFISGKYDEKQLLQFLINIKPTYEVVEERLLSSNIFKNKDLKRTPAITKDIKTLTQKHVNENNLDLLKPLKLTEERVSKAWAKPVAYLKADLYVRWLADFYGGRLLSAKLAPFNQMYICDNSQQVISDVRSIVDISTDSIGDDEFVNEVNSFFEHHVTLFNQIYNGISHTA